MAVVMYDSLFERITSRLARSVALEISFLVESNEHFPQTSEVQEINIAFLKKTQLETKFIENGTLPKTVKYNPYSPIDKTLISEFSNIGVPVWINSKAYNFVENIHQVWLLTICDLIIGKREYLPN